MGAEGKPDLGGKTKAGSARKLLFCSTVFYPSVGGVETVTMLISKALAQMGNEVRILTLSPAKGVEPAGAEVVRRPDLIELVASYRWADMVILMGDTLRLGWPCLFRGAPTALMHHVVYGPTRKHISPATILRRLMRRSCVNLAPSRAVGVSLGVPATIIGNPYDCDVFRERTCVARNLDLVFVGRLIPEKGADLLLRALQLLKFHGLHPNLTIIGAGAQDENLRAQAIAFGLSETVRFFGRSSGEELAIELNRHKIMVIPSRVDEGFGIVALEGIACGCVVVGSNGGGLPEAIGPCGVVYPNGDATALAAILEDILRHPDQLAQYRTNAHAHLEKHKPAVVARRYLEVLTRAGVK